MAQAGPQIRSGQKVQRLQQHAPAAPVRTEREKASGRLASRSPRRHHPGAAPIEGANSAADASRGGNAGGEGTDMRMAPRPVRASDVERDRQKLFPEAKTRRDDPDPNPNPPPPTQP